jgi:hypothetical protein
MTQDKTLDKTSQTSYKNSPQLDLFSRFLSNNTNKVSNTIEIWESIPKYFFTPRQVEQLRTSTGHADPYEWEYMRDDKQYKVEIQPALIKGKDGNFKAYFPGTTEEIVEEALKKILSHQHYGVHDSSSARTWVRFSLGMIFKELKSQGRTRSLDQIKHAITVMNKSMITVCNNKQEIWSGAILQDLVTVGREEYLEDTDSHHVARLPLFISHSINQLDYRQFNYERLMSCKEQLSRWIYKTMINKFTHAAVDNNYHFRYATLKNSGLLQQAREIDNRRKVIAALNELQKKGVITFYETKETKKGRKIVDVIYTVHPSLEFSKEQKAANRRLSISKETLDTKNTLSKPRY